MLNNRRNHYRMLFVQPDAPPEVLRANYRTLMGKLKSHPDLGGEHWNAVYVNEAYAVLGDPIRRAAYDLELLERYDIATLSRGPLPPRDQKRRDRTSAASANNQRNFYRILQVQPDSPLELIEASYRALTADGKVPTASVAEAFATLSDPARRETYDRALKAGGHVGAIAGEAVHLAPRPGDPAPHHQPARYPHARYEPLIKQYCLFCKTPHYATSSILEEVGCMECGSPLFAPPADFLAQARRVLGRSPLEEDLGFYTFWPGQRVRGRSLDLSPTGLRLLTWKTCEPGDIIKIDAERFQAVGEVVHAHREHALTTAGIKFHTVMFPASRGSFLSSRA